MGHMIKPKEKETKVFIDEFKGNKVFGIWEIDKEGNNVSDRPAFSFGKAKAKLILNHLEELKNFVEDN